MIWRESWKRLKGWLASRFQVSNNLGLQGEALAARYLQRLGYRIVERRMRNQFGELDLVAIDGRTVVFVEVKTRRGDRHGIPEEAVDTRKQIQIRRVALAYCKRHDLMEQSIRFDVVSVLFSCDGPQLTHYQAAF